MADKMKTNIGNLKSDPDENVKRNSITVECVPSCTNQEKEVDEDELKNRPEEFQKEQFLQKCLALGETPSMCLDKLSKIDEFIQNEKCNQYEGEGNFEEFIAEMNKNLEEEMKRLEELSALRIQAAYRGYRSRQKKFNYGNYKCLNEKNQKLLSSIEKINHLESSLMRVGLPCGYMPSGKKIIENNLKCLVYRRPMLGKEILIESENRDFDVQAIKKTPPTLSFADKKKTKKCSITIESKSEEKIVENCGDSLRLSKERKILMASESRVLKLQEGIHALSKKIDEDQNKELYKYHHLLRTKAIPGVFSNPYSCKLTQYEEKLKKLRFNAFPRKSVDHLASFENETRLRGVYNFYAKDRELIIEPSPYKLNFFDSDLKRFNYDTYDPFTYDCNCNCNY